MATSNETDLVIKTDSWELNREILRDCSPARNTFIHTADRLEHFLSVIKEVFFYIIYLDRLILREYLHLSSSAFEKVDININRHLNLKANGHTGFLCFFFCYNQ